MGTGLLPSFRGFARDAPEPEVARGGIDGLRHPGGRPITPAVVGRAEKRASLHDFSGHLYARCTRIVAVLARGCACARATGWGRGGVAPVPIRSPLPDVAGHIVEPIPI